MTTSSDTAALDGQLQGYLDHLTIERGVAANTISSYRRDLRRYAEHLSMRGIGDLREVAGTDGLDLLTPREREIARAAGMNYRNREISEMFGVSEGAVKMALYRVYEKLGVKNRVDLVLRLRDLGLLDELD